MNRMKAFFRNLVLVLGMAAVLFAGSAEALADKIHLKDGRVLEGRVQREGDGFVYFVVVIGKIEHVQFFTSAEYTKIERDADAAAAPVRADTAPSRPAAQPASGKVPRLAILNFGAPSSWQGEIDDTVGIQISAQAWRDAIPLLKRDGVTDVIVRINSGGGYVLEVPRFHDVLEKEYKKEFRVVCWVESAISAAAMSPYVVEEFYFMPDGNLGACTAWSGDLVAAKDVPLEMYLALMERASEMGGRDPKIMRAMQIMEPLSCNIDPVTGEVTWFQDESGKYLVNPANRVLTLNAADAVKYKFAKGIAATPDELARAMGYTEVEWGGKQAIDFIDKNMRDGDRTDKRLREVGAKYMAAITAAQQLQDRVARGAEVGRARRFLAEIRQYVRVNPNFVFLNPFGAELNNEWFDEQERVLRDLMR